MNKVIFCRALVFIWENGGCTIFHSQFNLLCYDNTPTKLINHKKHSALLKTGEGLDSNFTII